MSYSSLSPPCSRISTRYRQSCHGLETSEPTGCSARPIKLSIPDSNRTVEIKLRLSFHDDSEPPHNGLLTNKHTTRSHASAKRSSGTIIQRRFSEYSVESRTSSWVLQQRACNSTVIEDRWSTVVEIDGDAPDMFSEFSRISFYPLIATNLYFFSALQALETEDTRSEVRCDGNKPLPPLPRHSPSHALGPLEPLKAKHETYSNDRDKVEESESTVIDYAQRILPKLDSLVDVRDSTAEEVHKAVRPALLWSTILETE
jgi:hypothetical protein